MFKPIAATLLVLLPVAVSAEPPPVARDQVTARAERMFEIADRDHDGWLSRDEYRAAVLAVARRYDPKVPADRLDAATARFDALANATGGRMSERAFVTEATGHFDRADLNHDGRVTPDEARRAAALAAKAPPAR